MQLSKELLKSCMPAAAEANIDKFLAPLNVTLQKYSIDTPKRAAAFLAQLAHESGSLRYVREIDTGEAYDVGKLAVDLGNTPEDDGDGEMYKGRGLIQITGKKNYKALSIALNYDFLKNPADLEKPGAAAMSAGWFWNMRNLNKYADSNDFLKISKLINGVNRKTGLPNGWEDRLQKWSICKKALGVKETDYE